MKIWPNPNPDDICLTSLELGDQIGSINLFPEVANIRPIDSNHHLSERFKYLKLKTKTKNKYNKNKHELKMINISRLGLYHHL